MKRTILVALITLIAGLAMNANAKLSDEQKRFDLDGNGALSPEEDELMLRVTGLEAFTGEKFTREDIEDVNRSLNADRNADGPGGMPRFRGGRGRGPGPAEKIVAQFDTDGDGKLTGDERTAALSTRLGGDFSRVSPANPSGDIESDIAASRAAKPEGSPALYDEDTMRTLYLRFHDEDWYEQMNAFYRTDVEVPADLVVDGKVYRDVGVHFRGSSSYFTVDSEKKSFNIAVNYGDDGQRLDGYKTLNLLNGHVDASFMREVLYNRIARDYIPAMKSNFVKLVINGESWGVYINLQQYNKDFLAEWFGTRGGVRWKVGPGGGALVYSGDESQHYKETYQLKTKDAEDSSWLALIALCQLLDDATPDTVLEEKLPAVFNIDGALWQLAVANVFMDDDSYIHKGGDYAIYLDVNGRFHLIPHDNNESFLFARGGGRGGPGGGRGPGGWSWGTIEGGMVSPVVTLQGRLVSDFRHGGMVSPVTHQDSPTRPVIKRLLSHPQWRARYLAHVRTVVEEWLDWEVIEPIVTAYQQLINAEVRDDDKKLYSYQYFTSSISGSGGGGRYTPSLSDFVTQRRDYLLKHPELNKPVPKIVSVSKPLSEPIANQPVEIEAELDTSVAIDSVRLYYRTNRDSVFDSVEMKPVVNTSTVRGEIPAFPAGTTVYYYVEANAVKTHGTTTFWPARAEMGAAHYRVGATLAKETPVVINELMAANTNSLADPQGQHEDWLELHNVTDNAVSLAGMYLTDKADNPTKWAFPENTAIPARGYLIVWLDEDGKAPEGLHANFKLSRSGEIVMLVDTNARGNQVLDKVAFDEQQQDVAIGRWPNGTGSLRQVDMTPGEGNRLK